MIDPGGVMGGEDELSERFQLLEQVGGGTGVAGEARSGWWVTILARETLHARG